MLLEAIFSAGTIVLTEFVKATVTEIVRYCSNFLGKANSEKQNEPSSHQYKVAKDIASELEVIDTEVIDLEQKQKHDGKILRPDQERKEELESLRFDKFQDYQKAKKEENVEEYSKNLENYEASALNDDRVHILQYHMGQVVLERKCNGPRCGRPMILNSKQRLNGGLYCLNDSFWSCTGYYNQPSLQCRCTQQFQAADIRFLHKSDIFEFQISSQDLSQIFDEHSVKKATVDRMSSHLKEKDDEVLCSTHYVPMILREKLNHQGVVLDMYYLRCPHPGCPQLVKLKSHAQLAAFLRRREGRGIL
jgi:hypothetical protein